MKKYKIYNNSITTTSVTIYLLVMIFMCRASMVNIAILGALNSQIISLSASLLLLTVLYVSNLHDKTFLREALSKMSIALACSIPLLIIMVINQDYQLFYMTIILILFEISILSLVVDIKRLAKIFTYILASLAAYSLLINYIFRQIIFNHWPEWMNMINTAGYRFMNLIFGFVMDLPYYFRNYGIFREPGQYAFFISLALLSNLFIIKWENNKMFWVINIVLALTMLSTFSPSGLLSMVILFIAYCAKRLSNTSTKKMSKGELASVIIGVCLLSVITFFYIGSNSNISNTALSSIKKIFIVDNPSTKARVESLVFNTNKIIQRPLRGNGSVVLRESIDNNTFTFGVVFAVFGFIVGLPFVILWWCLVPYSVGYRNPLVLSLIFLSVLAVTSSQNFISEFFFYLMPFLVFLDNLNMRRIMNSKSLFKIFHRRLA